MSMARRTRTTRRNTRRRLSPAGPSSSESGAAGSRSSCGRTSATGEEDPCSMSWRSGSLICRRGPKRSAPAHWISHGPNRSVGATPFAISRATRRSGWCVRPPLGTRSSGGTREVKARQPFRTSAYARHWRTGSMPTSRCSGSCSAKGSARISTWMRHPGAHTSGLNEYLYDPAKAESLIRSAGYSRGTDGIYEKDGRALSFTLVTNAGNDLRTKVIQFATDQYRSIGIQVTPKLVNFKEFTDRVGAGDPSVEAFVLGWTWSTDPF